MRTLARFNPDIPGAIELVHPNKFLPNLRPVEDFRHTPIIPISEKDILANKKKIEAYINATVKILNKGQSEQKIEYAKKTQKYIDTVFKQASADLKTIEKNITKKTKLIFVENPGSNSFEFQDLGKIISIAKKNKILTAIDNTWATPYYFKPIKF